MGGAAAGRALSVGVEDLSCLVGVRSRDLS